MLNAVTLMAVHISIVLKNIFLKIIIGKTKTRAVVLGCCT